MLNTEEVQLDRVMLSWGWFLRGVGVGVSVPERCSLSWTGRCLIQTVSARSTALNTGSASCCQPAQLEVCLGQRRRVAATDGLAAGGNDAQMDSLSAQASESALSFPSCPATPTLLPRGCDLPCLPLTLCDLPARAPLPRVASALVAKVGGQAVAIHRVNVNGVQ